MKRLNHFYFILLLSQVMLNLILKAEQSEIDSGVSSKGDAIFINKTKIRDPLSLRDPFKMPALPGHESKGTVDVLAGTLRDGVYTNLPSIEEYSLEQIKITGVLIGKERRAIATLDNNTTMILKEGMTIGRDNAEIKAILPGGVVLVEKIVNVYGQDEYLETIIPIAEGSGSNVDTTRPGAVEIKQ